MTDEQNQEPLESAHDVEEKKKAEVEETSLIDKATKTAEDLKRENDRKEALLDREEKLRATEMLGGKTFAGQAVKKQESPADYAKRVMAGDI